MGVAPGHCVIESAECKGIWRGDGALERIPDDPSESDLDGDVKNSQALINHKLLKAAREGSTKDIEKSLQGGAFMETRRPFVMTPESRAAPDPTPRTRGVGLTPLMYAAQGGYPEACELLLQRGAFIGAEEEDGLTALHFAAASGSEGTCKVLLSYGADPEHCDDDGQTALEHVPDHAAATPWERNHWRDILHSPNTGSQAAAQAT